MNKTNSTSPNIKKTSLLTFSTWLAIGFWLIFTGAELIFKTPSDDNSLGYLLGAFRIFVGVHAVRSARLVADKSREPQGASLRSLTSIILFAIVGLPLLLFIYQTLIILFGVEQPNELYRENAVRLMTIAVCYLIATIFAGWRLKE